MEKTTVRVPLMIEVTVGVEGTIPTPRVAPSVSVPKTQKVQTKRWPNSRKVNRGFQPKMDEEKVRAIRAILPALTTDAKFNASKVRELAAVHNVSDQTIYGIISHRYWGHVRQTA